MHKLNAGEAERVRLVLAETIERLKVLQYVPQVYDEELMRMLSEHKGGETQEVLCSQFQLEEAVKSSKRSSGPLVTKLAANTRSLCRVLGEDDCTMKEVKRRVGVNEGFETLLQSFGMLQTCTYRMLATTLEDETAKQRLLSEVFARELQRKEEHDTLATELELLRREKGRALNTLAVKESKISDEISELKGHSGAEGKRIKKITADKLSRNQESHEKMKEELSKQREALEQSIEAMKIEHEELEMARRKKVRKAEEETKNWVANYDSKMKEKYLKLKLLTSRLKKEEQRVVELENYFTAVDEEKARIQQEEIEWQQFLKERKEKESIHDKGAMGLQKLYRGATCRAQLAASSKKKGKKK